LAPAVLFDLDGTLTPRSASLERFALLFAQDFEDSLAPIGIAELTRRLIALDQGGYNPRRAHDLREQLDWRAAPEASALDAYWQRRLPEVVVPQPGLHEVLDELVSRGLRIGIVTNGGVEGQRRKIERLGLADRKPAPAYRIESLSELPVLLGSGP
jgi:putative hydrolase of the HAD superfamily